MIQTLFSRTGQAAIAVVSVLALAFLFVPMFSQHLDASRPAPDAPPAVMTQVVALRAPAIPHQISDPGDPHACCHCSFTCPCQGKCEKVCGCCAAQAEDDYEAMRAEAIRTGKPLLVWVGYRDPLTESFLPQVLHCHRRTFAEAADRSVVVARVQQGDLFRVEDLHDEPAADAIRAALTPPAPPAPARVAWTPPPAPLGPSPMLAGRACSA